MEYILNDYMARHGDAIGRTDGLSPAAARQPLGSDPLDAFRVRAPHKVLALLKQLLGGSVMVSLTPPRGATYVTMLWAVDPALDLVSLAADLGNPRVHEVVGSGTVMASAQLDSIRIQFELTGVKLVRGSTGSVFNAPLPRELYRFQRRADLRVAPAANGVASARLRHPAVAGGAPIVLKVLDLCARGVGLAVPTHIPPLAAGTRLDGVQIDLDQGHRVLGALQVQHLHPLRPLTRGWRAGCELVSLSDSSVSVMRSYLDGARGRPGLPVMVI